MRSLLLVTVFCALGCTGTHAVEGPAGPPGADGVDGADGEQGPPGPAGASANYSGTRLLARWRAGGDNSREFIGWHDSLLNVDCHWQLATDGAFRCMPLTTTVTLYLDDQCQIAVGLGFCGVDKYSYDMAASGACGAGQYTYREVADELAVSAGTQFYRKNQAGCYPNSNSEASDTIYQLGPALVPATFMGSTIEVGP